MAEKEVDLDALDGGKPASNKKLIIIMVIVMLVAIGASVGVTLMLVGGEQTVEDEIVEEAPKDATYIPLKAMTVTFPEGSPAQFLQIEITLMSYNPESADLINTHMPLIRNDVLNLLGGATFEKMSANEGKEEMRGQLLTQLQKLMMGIEGTEAIDAVYFTKLIMQ